MKRLSCFLAIVGLALSTAIASAQYPQPKSQPKPQPNRYSAARPAVSSSIAVINLTRVFKEHRGFMAFQKSHEAAVKNLKARMDQENQTIQNLYKKMKELKVGSMQYMNIDSEITNRKAKFQADMESQEKQWMLHQANMYHTVYTEVQGAVERVAVSRGIVMVLQTTDIKSNPEKPATVKLNLDKEIVWRNKSVDITDAVIAMINPGRRDVVNRTGGNNPTPPVRKYN